MHHVLRAPVLTAQGFRHGFSSRRGGVSRPPFDSFNLADSVGDDPAHVAHNQQLFAGWVGYEGARLYTASQVHGRQVRVLTTGDSPEAVRAWQGDALVAPAGMAIGIRTADCVPVLLADPHSRWVAAVHAGWRGVVSGVVTAALQALCASADTAPERLLVALFPHIGRCCFEVGGDVAQQLEAANPGAAQCVFALGSGKPHVALDAIICAQLMALGVGETQIATVAGCTCCDRERFFSYRRDGAACGRHFTVIVG